MSTQLEYPVSIPAVSNGQPLQAKVFSSAPVQLIERIAHATRACPPELSIQHLYLLKFGINHSSLVRERHKSRVLRLQCGDNRCEQDGRRERRSTDEDEVAYIGGCIVFVRKLMRVSVRFARKSLVCGRS